MFLTAMMLGLVGLVAMALLGISHGGHHSRHAQHRGSHGAHHGNPGQRILMLTSPRAIFSLALGFGAVGLVVNSVLPTALTIVVAVLGGLAFENWLVRPYFESLFAFASRPAKTLESAVMGEARAETDFDSSGAGIVSLEMDGQVRQLLGNLEQLERAAGLRVRRGERLRVLSVLPNGSCVVSKLH